MRFLKKNAKTDFQFCEKTLLFFYLREFQIKKKEIRLQFNKPIWFFHFRLEIVSNNGASSRQKEIRSKIVRCCN